MQVCLWCAILCEIKSSVCPWNSSLSVLICRHSDVEYFFFDRWMLVFMRRGRLVVSLDGVLWLAVFSGLKWNQGWIHCNYIACNTARYEMIVCPPLKLLHRIWGLHLTVQFHFWGYTWMCNLEIAENFARCVRALSLFSSFLFLFLFLADGCIFWLGDSHWNLPGTFLRVIWSCSY